MVLCRAMASGEDIRTERLKKLDLLREAGMEAYPARTARSSAISAFVSDFEKNEAGATDVTLAGRIMSLRGQGGIAFADLFDGTGRVQAVLQKEDMDASLFTLWTNAVDAGDFVEVTGSAYTTKRGEKSLKARTWKMVSKSLMPIPSEWYGLKDEEKRLRERELDILMNENVRGMVERRAKFWAAIREFMTARGFIEVETPVLETMPGGADARPFITHHNALDIDVYLRISAGELWQKRLLIAGLPKVFEIGRIFRNEGQSREHLQDYTQLESYEAYADVTSGMEMTRDLFRHIAERVYGKTAFEVNGHSFDLQGEWKTINFSEVVKETFGVDPISCTDREAIAAAEKAGIDLGEGANKSRAVDALWKQIRKTVSGPAFLVGVPVYLEPLAKRDANNPNIVERMQIVLAGSELAKGFSELNDPIDQRARFEEQQKLREAGDDEAQRLDDDYVRAMEYGMPPAFGLGFSERLFAFLEGKPAHETQIFPLMKPRNE